MLEFYTPVAICFYICNVLFTAFVKMDFFLPVFREFTFPRTMPVSFGFPSRITVAVSFMRPVINIDFSTPSN